MELNIQHEEGGAFDNLEPAGRVYRAAVSSSSSPFHTVGVQAESKMGRRRIIQYLLSPISQALDEGGRGR